MEKGDGFMLCKEVNAALGRHFKRNPHYEKWGPGRPSKEKIERRRLSQEWETENRSIHLKALFESGQTPVKVEGEGKARKVTLQYIARTY